MHTHTESTYTDTLTHFKILKGLLRHSVINGIRFCLEKQCIKSQGDEMLRKDVHHGAL